MPSARSHGPDGPIGRRLRPHGHATTGHHHRERRPTPDRLVARRSRRRAAEPRARLPPTPVGARPCPRRDCAAAATAPFSPRPSPRPSSRRSSPPASRSTSDSTSSATTCAGCPSPRSPAPGSAAAAPATSPTVLEVDGLAFDRFWRFDATGLADARTATPHARFRVATDAREVVGYHVTGRAGTLGLPAATGRAPRPPRPRDRHRPDRRLARLVPPQGLHLGPGQHPGGQPAGPVALRAPRLPVASPPASPCSSGPSTTDRRGEAAAAPSPPDRPPPRRRCGPAGGHDLGVGRRPRRRAGHLEHRTGPAAHAPDRLGRPRGRLPGRRLRFRPPRRGHRGWSAPRAGPRSHHVGRGRRRSGPGQHDLHGARPTGRRGHRTRRRDRGEPGGQQRTGRGARRGLVGHRRGLPVLRRRPRRRRSARGRARHDPAPSRSAHRLGIGADSPSARWSRSRRRRHPGRTDPPRSTRTPPPRLIATVGAVTDQTGLPLTVAPSAESLDLLEASGAAGKAAVSGLTARVDRQVLAGPYAPVDTGAWIDHGLVGGARRPVRLRHRHRAGAARQPPEQRDGRCSTAPSAPLRSPISATSGSRPSSCRRDSWPPSAAAPTPPSPSSSTSPRATGSRPAPWWATTRRPSGWATAPTPSWPATGHSPSWPTSTWPRRRSPARPGASPSWCPPPPIRPRCARSSTASPTPTARPAARSASPC